MSWIFGNITGNKSANQLPSNFDLNSLSSGIPPDSDNNEQSNKQQQQKQTTQTQLSSGYAFDSTGLERAAKCARELERSPNAKHILELSSKQEITRQEEYRSKAKEYEAAIEHAKIEQKRIDYDERKKLLNEEAKIAQQKSQYDDQLARKRYQDQLAQQKKANEDILREQESSITRQAQIKREEEKRLAELQLANAVKQAQLQEQSDLKRIEAKMKAKAKMERENHDIYLEKFKLKATEDRKTRLESIKSFGETFGNGFRSLTSDPDRVKNVVFGITLTALGIYTAKHSIGIVGRAIESRISKPQLVRETTRLNVHDIFLNPIKTMKRILLSSKRDALKDVILRPELEKKLRDLAIAIRNTKKNKGVFSNALFYGPPGTGKTLVAKNLTTYSGMDYAILTGADFAPLGTEAPTAIHKLFDWASTSRRGLIVFIDEADAFLRDRNTFQFSENLLNAQNAFLNRTGEKSENFMLILSSNLQSDFDKAMNTRLDINIKFDIPGLEERQRLVRLYFEKFILEPVTQKKRRLKVADFDYDKVCSDIAQMTDGFSAREISYLGTKWQAATYQSLEAILTEELMMQVVSDTLKERSERKIEDAKLKRERLLGNKQLMIEKDEISRNE